MKPMRIAFFIALSSGLQLLAAERSDKPAPTPQAAALGAYFAQQVGSIEGQLDREIKTKEDWLAKKDGYRHELADMLGLDPMPPRTELHATKTGEFEHEGLIVETLHYQSMPGLYVTANLYRPKLVDKPLPTVLYVCGHSSVTKDGVSYGNKVGYEHHGLWYAKHGFVCMIIDTVELGELRGSHHGTYSQGRWWWFSRGYTPAGVEAWAGIRGLDYLETRAEVDKARFGVAGRSGGGAYSWWIAALDERIKAAVPTAGITDLRNHVVDGCVEGHCDCMFFVNTYRWDYDKLAALVAPRALCITNTDKDPIFPIDGVFRIYNTTRRIYKLLGAENNIGLQIAEGPHADTQPLNTGEFHWMTRFLQGTPPLASFDTSTKKSVEMEQLKVFKELPADERNTKIDESFVPLAFSPKVPETSEQWSVLRQQWMKALSEKCFHGWPTSDASTLKTANAVEHDGVHISASDLTVEGQFPLRIWFAHRAGLKPQELELVVLNVLDESDWHEFVNTYGGKFGELFAKDIVAKPDENAFAEEKKMYSNFKWGMAYVCPRGIGPTAWDAVVAKDADAKIAAAAMKAQTQRLRRFYLVGQTLDAQQTYDIQCAIHALRAMDGLKETKLWLQAYRDQAGNALYASLFEDHITRLDLHQLPHSHQQGPIYLNVLKYLDIPQAAAMAAERTRLVIYDDDKLAWDYTKAVSEKLGWGKDKNGLQLRDVPKAK